MAEEVGGALERLRGAPDTICGSVCSSSMALPSAIRSGQKLTSSTLPCLVSSRSTRAVTPGYTVERITRCWPSRRWSTMSSMARTTASDRG